MAQESFYGFGVGRSVENTILPCRERKKATLHKYWIQTERRTNKPRSDWYKCFTIASRMLDFSKPQRKSDKQHS